ncbi:MAG: hypothetical protein J5493_04680 [Lachnospiraceae bacterium]|nr:hypothetical protein [Lachnospiraceae bacterium]MBQ6241853.1 hypothetical protein [Lachnospiraceae bacterium]
MTYILLDENGKFLAERQYIARISLFMDEHGKRPAPGVTYRLVCSLGAPEMAVTSETTMADLRAFSDECEEEKEYLSDLFDD